MQQVGTYQRITVSPISGYLGAEIGNVDVRNLDDETFGELRRAFADHAVIAIKGQTLTPAEFEHFGRRWGNLAITSYVPPLAGTTHVQHMLKEAGHRWGDRSFGDNWHQDQTIRENPNLLAALYSIDVPPQGGDTMFASLYVALETLSPKLQGVCEDLTLIHCARGLYGENGTGGLGVKKAINRTTFTITDEELRAHLARETLHPLVIEHPVTGRKVLFISGPYAVRFDGMTEEESQPLIQYLYQHAQRPEFAIRWRWQPNEIIIWDNWATLHFGVQDYAPFRREMIRFEVEGPVPMARIERASPLMSSVA